MIPLLPNAPVGIGRIIYIIGSLIGMVVPIVLTIGLITFFWGVIKYMMSGADAEGRQDARNIMIYGIIGVFVMVSVWGLVAVIGRSLGIGSGGTWMIPLYPDPK